VQSGDEKSNDVEAGKVIWIQMMIGRDKASLLEYTTGVASDSRLYVTIAEIDSLHQSIINQGSQ
jgi:hypothetical protein